MNVQSVSAVGFYAKPWKTAAERAARKAGEIADESPKPTPKLRQNVSDRNNELHKVAAKQIKKLTDKIQNAENYVRMIEIAKSHTEDPNMINFINKELDTRKAILSQLNDMLVDIKSNLARAYYKTSGNL